MMHVAGGRVCGEHMPRSLSAYWRRLEGHSISHEAVGPPGRRDSQMTLAKTLIDWA